VEVTRSKVVHYIRTHRDEERLSGQRYTNTPFGSDILLSEVKDDFPTLRDSIRVHCGSLSFICGRKELTMWR
jgi:hypothetical protein